MLSQHQETVRAENEYDNENFSGFYDLSIVRSDWSESG